METKKVILTHSYKGGTGKTTFAINMAYYLAEHGFKTLLVDGDLIAPSLTSVFGQDIKAINTWTDVLEGTVATEEAIYPTPKENLGVVFSPDPEVGKKFLSEKGPLWWVKSLRTTVQSRNIWFEKLGYDYVVLDNQNGLSMNSANNITIADVLLLVLRPITYAVEGTAHLVGELYSTLRSLWDRKDYLIWNQIPNDPELDDVVEEVLQLWTNSFEEKGLTTIAKVYYNQRLAIQMLRNQEGQITGVYDIIQNEVAKIFDRIGLLSHES